MIFTWRSFCFYDDKCMHYIIGSERLGMSAKRVKRLERFFAVLLLVIKLTY